MANRRLLEHPSEIFKTEYISFITPETIEALNQKYETDPTLYINIETLKSLPPSRARLLNKNLFLRSFVHAIDISKSFKEQFQDDPELLPTEMTDALQPLLAQKVQKEFLQDPNRTINSEYIDKISPETLEKIPKGQSINPQTIALLSIPQLESLDPSILANYMIQRIDLSKPVTEQQISQNLLYFLTPKKGYAARNEKIRAFEQSFLPELKIKINTKFKMNPNMRLDPSYVQYLDPKILKKLTIQRLNGSTIEAMNKEQLQALPQDIFIYYLIDRIDLTKTIRAQNFPDAIQNFLEDQGTQLAEKFRKQLKQKVNDSVTQNPYNFLNPEYLQFLTPENMQELAKYIISDIDLTKPLDTQQIFTGEKTEYLENKEFKNDYQAALKERINKIFKNYPDTKLNPSYTPYIDTTTIQNVTLVQGQQINTGNIDIIMQMSPEQLQAFKPEVLQKIMAVPTTQLLLYEKFAKFADKLTAKEIATINGFTRYIPNQILTKMTLEQINALNLTQLSLSQLNALLETHDNKIILSVIKKISLSAKFEIEQHNTDLTQRVIHNLQSLLDSLSPEQLQELATESIDPEVRKIAEEIFKKKYSSSLKADQKILKTKLDKQQQKVAQLKQQLTQLTQAQSKERATLEDELEDAQAQVAEYEEFKKIAREFQQEAAQWQDDYNAKKLDTTTTNLQLKNRLKFYLEDSKNPNIPNKDAQISALQQQLIELNEELAQSKPSAETIYTSSQDVPQSKPVKTKVTIPKEFIPTEEEIETQTQDIETEIQNTQVKITKLEAQIQSAQEAHKSIVTDLQQKLQAAKEQIAEYEENKKIIKELQRGADAEKLTKEKELQNLERNNNQLNERLTAILNNNQDQVIATLTQQVNALRARLGRPPLPTQQKSQATSASTPTEVPTQPTSKVLSTNLSAPQQNTAPQEKGPVKKTLSGFTSALEVPQNQFEGHSDTLGTTPNLRRNVVIPGWSDTHSFDDPLAPLGISNGKNKGPINSDDI